MRNSGLELDIIFYNVVIDGLCKAGHFEDANELFRELSVNGLKPDVYTYTIMINGFCKGGLADEAYQLFKSMRDNECLLYSIPYNVMVQGLFRNNYTSKATQLLAEMVDKGFSADLCTATLHSRDMRMLLRIGCCDVYCFLAGRWNDLLPLCLLCMEV
ncbi:hypothetical protein V6N12_010701 [Hibiscus sabdariffa]|uniref:Pentatricopeptide repeat-containing protein n=1 Tax=Hibiscus sabdariffa TaxID=183260 RepID=A0ABR2EKX0_9ROSI